MQSRTKLAREEPHAANGLREVFFTVAVTAAFTLGCYSLFLASAKKGELLPLAAIGLVHTATAADVDRIGLAAGPLAKRDLVFVVLDTSNAGPDPTAVNAARRAARTLTDTGTDASVRLLGPSDSDFEHIVTQNEIARFPAVLVVKKNGGIVHLTNEFDEEGLVSVYRRVWGTASSCSDAISDIY